jgi:hypothetical protein
MRLAMALLGLGLSACAASPPPQPRAPAIDARSAWEHIRQTMPGSWEATTASGKVVKVSYRLVSNESALVETFVTPSGKETVTIFHLDCDRLLMTHYCAQGNQPRLRAIEAARDDVRFKFADATNVLAGQAVLMERSFHFGGDRMDATEVYQAPNRSLETTTFHFSRSTP